MLHTELQHPEEVYLVCDFIPIAYLSALAFKNELLILSNSKMLYTQHMPNLNEQMKLIIRYYEIEKKKGWELSPKETEHLEQAYRILAVAEGKRMADYFSDTTEPTEEKEPKKKTYRSIWNELMQSDIGSITFWS